MAGPLPCDNHPDRLAATLMTDLETGNTLTLCQDCMVSFAEMVCGILPEPPEPDPAATTATEELADLEPEPPVPDAGPKSQPEPETPPVEAAEHPAQTAQESTAPGD